MAEDNGDLSLSGRVFTENGDLLSSGIRILAEVTKLKPGDAKLHYSHDAQGRMAMQGGHTNVGFSGWINVSVWDGRTWKRASLQTLLGQDAHFPSKQEMSAAAHRVEKLLAAKAGVRLAYGVPEGKKRAVFSPVVD